MASINYNFRGGLADADGDLTWASQFGQSGADLPAGQFLFADGTGDGQVDTIVVVDFSVATTVTTQYNLRSGLTDVLNQAVVLAKLKFVYIELDAANTGDVWFGPMNLTDGLEAWFDGVGATARERVKHRMLHDCNAGWTVDNTHKILAIYNATGSTVTGTMVLAGSS